ncbi:MAG: cell division protein SepF [Candidatus Sericytochromatia bacterium]|nr:cell division protein SepF [Candidatus Sericytochromatia bacterium]
MGDGLKNFMRDFFGVEQDTPEGPGSEQLGGAVDNTVPFIRPASRSVDHEMLVVEPLSFEEAPALISEIKSRRSLLINLHLMPGDQHQRLVDLLTGAIVALDGQSQRISKDIFTFVPSNVNLAAAPRGQQTWNQPPAAGAGQQIPAHYVHSAV